MVNIISLILVIPPVFVSLWVIASVMTKEVLCGSCGRRIKLRHGQLHVVNPHHSSMDIYYCPGCAKKILSK